MNSQLQQVKEFREHLGLDCKPEPLPEMKIILRQAWLMDTGKEALLALRRGEMAEILTHLTALAYLALNAVAEQEGRINQQTVFWLHDGSVASVMRLIVEKIAACSSGNVTEYSGLYCTAAYLATNFLNADFGKAFDAFLRHQIQHSQPGKPVAKDCPEIMSETMPDLCDCMYE